jgi:hypothetical protein
VVNVGQFSRNGVSRVPTKALDHDFHADKKVTPLGFLLPKQDELTIYTVTTRVTSDCIVDCLANWWADVRSRFPDVTTLMLNLDNGPDCNSHRTQFMARLVNFVNDTGMTVRLAYYPPYHSKYNPVERCWGILENHWNGSLLDSVEAVVRFASSMTWKGLHPTVNLVKTMYEKGVTLTKDQMREVEKRLRRLPGLENWFVDIQPRNSSG